MDENFEILKDGLINKKTIYIEYCEKYIKYKKEYNTDKFIFFMQIGGFYENYSWEIKNKNFYLFNVESKKTANILNMIRSYKNRKKGCTYDYPRMYGFPISAKDKHIDRLLDEGYTIVLISQRDNPNSKKKIRDIVEKYTPGTNTNNKKEDNYIMSIYLNEENNKKYCGLSLVNINTNEIYIYECYNTDYNKNNVINSIVKIILQFDPVEYLIYNMTDIKNKLLINLLNIYDKTYLFRNYILSDYKNINYQKQFFEKIYGNNYLSPLDNFNLNNLPYARLSYLLLLQYINNQNSLLLKVLKYPTYISFDNNLNLDYNTAEQLNIIGETYEKYTILSLLDYTSTNMGKRMLKKNILCPSSNLNEIQTKYNLIEEMINNNNYEIFEVELDELPDITKKHKKIFFETISPMELYDLNQSYNFIINILNKLENNKLLKEYINNNYELNINEITDYLNNFNNIFIEDNIRYCRDIQEIVSNIFQTNYNIELDKLSNKLENVKVYRNKLKLLIDNFLSTKNISKYETKFDKNLIYITKTKLKIIKPNMKDNFLIIGEEKFYHKVLNKKDYLTTDKLEKINRDEYLTLDKLRVKTEKLYTDYLKELINKQDFYDKLDNIIGFIDYIKSGTRCAIENNYIKPILDYEEEESYFDIKNIRHPIIETINKDIPFVKNNLRLDKKTKGLILSGINGTGKSSLLKNIGLIIVIAQSGYYVPSTYMKYRPFNKILTRIKGNDNIYTNSSSFMVEMQELSNILKKADNKSLILIDELARGTEHASTHGLTIAVINDFIYKKKSRFILTSHLHSIFTNENIKKMYNNKDIFIKHLSIEIEKDNIKYLRKLTEGSSLTNYGILVAKSFGIENSIINDAMKIKNNYLNVSNDIINIKRSLYNKNVYMTECELCKKTKNLETHHIIEQKEANVSGFILSENFHKNDKHNLIILCKNCHSKITFGKMKISQRYLTTNGIKYDIINIENEKIDDEKIYKIVYDLRENKNKWKEIPKIIKNKYNILVTEYKCKKIYKKYN